MNRSKFESFARKNGLLLERLENDKRYASMETEWAWRGFQEATKTLTSDHPLMCTRWCRGDNKFDPSHGDYNGYTVKGVTNLAHKHKDHEPHVVYEGDNGNLWSLPLSRWPGNLKPENGGRICAICDGGPGNECSCSCGMQKWEV